MRRRLWPIPWLMAWALFTACKAAPPTPNPGLDLDRAEACRRVVGRLAGVESFSAEIEITFAADDEEHTASGALVVSAPDRVRMRCWGPLGVTVMDLLVVDDGATLFLPQDERAQIVDLGQVRERTDLPRGIRSLALVKTLLEELTTSTRDWRPVDDADEPALFLLSGGTPVARIVYDPVTLFPQRREDLVYGTIVTYADFQQGRRIWWPGEIRISEAEYTIRVRVEDVVENPPLTPEMFELELPAGTRVERP